MNVGVAPMATGCGKALATCDLDVIIGGVVVAEMLAVFSAGQNPHANRINAPNPYPIM